jgi:hypothetical protein
VKPREIVAWSVVSGAVMGLIVGVLLLGAVVLAVELLPLRQAPPGGFWKLVIVMSVVGLPVAGGVLGWGEGRGKVD